MNLETFEIISCDDAIRLLQDLKKKKKDCKVIITSFDFNNNEEKRNLANPDIVCVLVKKSNTIILNRDEFLPHMQLYSNRQVAENIVREGIMHDVMLFSKLE